MLKNIMNDSNIGKSCFYTLDPSLDIRFWSKGEIIQEYDDEYLIRYYTPFHEKNYGEFKITKPNVIVL